ncbi:MAG: PepSY domain-containing protein [Planctomycetes bacterium]|nr:PepSY domain-containing protein [Planctomycetota bacterium]
MSSRPRRRVRGVRLLGAALALWAGSGLAVFAGEPIPLEELPVAVVEAIEQRFPGAQLLAAEREHDDGRLLYEVKVKSEGALYEVEVTEDGVVVDVDRED